MGLLKDVKSWTGRDPDARTEVASVSRQTPLFVYIKIPGNIQPLERADRFEDPLQAVLHQADLGEVTGGGSQLDDPDEFGQPQVAFCGIDVELYEAERGLAVVRVEMRRLGPPKGTILLYELNGEEYEEDVLEA